MTFAEDLKRYGPDSSTTCTLEAAREYCARLAASHYENFSVISMLTPRRLRPAFEAVYAFCRWSDDLGDEVGDRAKSTELLRWWKGQLQAMYEGVALHPVFVALGPVVREFGIPITPFGDLICAFEQDQVVTEYESYNQLLDYCRRSADPVGRIVLYLSGCFDERNARLSDKTCTALQLANFWQDVARDLAIGRVYLPRADREQFGVTLDDLRVAPAGSGVRALLKFEVQRTRDLFREGAALIPLVSREISPCIELFTQGGLAILDRIEGQEYDVLTRRPKLGRLTKLRLVLRAWLRQTVARGGGTE
jgi:squalene synthase HpnC